MKTKVDIEKRIQEIKPFFEQLFIFFVLVVLYGISLLIFNFTQLARYTLIVFLTGFAISLILQELYLYHILKPKVLGKRWEEMARKSFKRKRR